MPSKPDRVRRTVTPPTSSVSGVPNSLLGLWVSGDLAGFTFYTTKTGRKVCYPEAPAVQPPSQLQQRMRARFKCAYLNWKELSSEDKANLEQATKKLGLCLTGQNLYVSTQLTGKISNYKTVARQAKLNLPALEYVP